MSTRTILLVEDDIDDHELFIIALSEIKNAPPIDIVRDGKSALDRLYRSMILPKLIFMDINMPLMNGIECLTYIKDDPLIKHLPIVMLTSSHAEKEKALESGASGYIVKTAKLDELRRSLERFINHFFYEPQGWQLNKKV